MRKCKLIAEIGWNHMGDMELAREMIKSASQSGADYVKFQTWKEKDLKNGPWDNDGRREIYKKAQLSEDDHIFLKKECEKNNVKFLTSCFNINSLDFIRSISEEVKIPSTECFNNELVEKAIKNFDRVYISTGASKFDEYAKWAQYNNVILLHCVSTYPCQLEHINLPKLRNIMSLVPNRFGYSGHLSGIWDAIAAISLGAIVIEKHFTIDRSLPGRDNQFSLLPDMLEKVSEYIDIFETMNTDLGNDFQTSETDARQIYSGRWAK